MKQIKFTSKTTLQIKKDNESVAVKYKGYEVGSLPLNFGFIFDKIDDKDGINSWFNYKGLTYLPV